MFQREFYFLDIMVRGLNGGLDLVVDVQYANTWQAPIRLVIPQGNLNIQLSIQLIRGCLLSYRPMWTNFIGMTTRELRIRIQEHLKDIWAASRMDAHDLFRLNKLKPVPKHFYGYHSDRWQDVRVCRIDRVSLGSRGGNLSKHLEQVECKWIVQSHHMA